MIDSWMQRVGGRSAAAWVTHHPEAIAILLKGRDQVYPLEDVERAIAGLKDVSSARIITDSEGGILEIHVVSDAARSAKQVARDVESMLVAKLGVPIDHRKISVAQVDGEGEQERGHRPAPEKTKPARGIYLAPDDQRIEFVGVSLAQANGIAQVRVELSRDEIATVAQASAADSLDSVNRIVAEATLEAIQRFFVDGGQFTVTAVEKTTLGGKPIMAVSVDHVSDRNEHTLTGACPVNGDVQRAVALATLDAVNRFLRRLEPKVPTEYELGPASES
jgi:hypothetical protein